MTTGRGNEPDAQCRSREPTSITSALLLSSKTVARRTVHTLIGSYVALRTSTRPPDQRPQPSDSGPCRWESIGGTDPSGAGGTAAVAIAGAKCSPADHRNRPLARDAPGSSRPQRCALRAPGFSPLGEDPQGNLAPGPAFPSVERDGAELAREGDADGLGLLGGELELALAGHDLLAVHARGLAVGDRGQHDAAVASVEQRQRGRLVPGELAV